MIFKLFDICRSYEFTVSGFTAKSTSCNSQSLPRFPRLGLPAGRQATNRALTQTTLYKLSISSLISFFNLGMSFLTVFQTIFKSMPKYP